MENVDSGCCSSIYDLWHCRRQSVSADDKKTLKVAMECGYAPYNWTQPDDSNGAVQISGAPITHMDMML